MAVDIRRRDGVGKGQTVAVWTSSEGFIESNLPFTEDPVYDDYTEEQMLHEFDGPDLFAVPRKTDPEESQRQMSLDSLGHPVDNVDDESRTAKEQEILAGVAEREGWEWVKGNREHILNQARLMGELVGEEEAHEYPTPPNKGEISTLRPQNRETAEERMAEVGTENRPGKGQIEDTRDLDSNLVPSGEHDAVYSNPVKQVEYLREDGQSEEEIHEFLREKYDQEKVKDIMSEASSNGESDSTV